MENTIQKENELIGNTDNLKPEPIELRPEELVSGEVYKNVIKFNNETIGEYIYEFIGLVGGNKAKYSKMINHDKVLHYNDDLSVTTKAPNFKYIKIFHATPEEKALLLGEEETDWKAKFEELQNRYEVLVTESHKLDVLSGEMCDKYTELKEQVENQNNQAKVYFYFDNDLERNLITSNLKDAITNSKENESIYEAICIGKKKSVLVNENS